MTAIVGFIDGERNVHMAADGRAAKRNIYAEIRESKIIERAGLLIGVAGSIRLHDLIRHRMEIKPPWEEVQHDLPGYLVHHFISSLCRTMREQGLGANCKDHEGIAATLCLCSDVLIGYNGQLCIIEPNQGVVTPACAYAAIGCGEEYVYGAMHVLYNSMPSELVERPDYLLRRSLEATDAHCQDVGPPYTFKTLAPIEGETNGTNGL